MKTSVVSGLAACAAVVASMPTIEAAEVMAWEGDIQLGENITLTGTAESIYEQILQLNPDFIPHDPPDYVSDISRGEGEETTMKSDRTTLESRAAPPPDAIPQPVIHCNSFPNKRMSPHAAKARFNHLYAIQGSCGLAAKPHCTQVTCKDGHAIFGCGRTGSRITVPCTRLADGAADILGRCVRNGKVSGRATYPRFFDELRNAPCN